MKVGMNEAQELKRLSDERGLSFANLLRTYVLEDLMARIYSSGYQKCLWLKDDRMLGEAGCRRGSEETLFFYYKESVRAFPEDKLVPGQKLSVRLMEAFADQVLRAENSAQVRWQSEAEKRAGLIFMNLLAFYKGMKVPVTLQVAALAQEVQNPERRVLERVASAGRELVYWRYSSENQLSQDLFQIMDKLELIGDMGAYYRTYRILCTQPLSGRHMVEELSRLAERTPQVKNERRLAQLGGYREYAYMRKRWDQYIRRQRMEPAVWEEALDLILALATPIWQSLCRNEIFLEDWMPELGRYM